MEKREIDRHPKVPQLNDEVIELITKLCFRPDDPLEKVDLIFVFSSPLEPDIVANIIEDLLIKGISQKVFVAGGVPLYEGATKVNRSESSRVLERINRAKFPHVQFYYEENSRNSLENVAEALKILDFSDFRKVLFVFKSHDSRRGYLTLRKFLPNAKIIQRTFSAQYPNTEKVLNAQTWYTYDFGKSRVWGEFLRIKTYGERGDIVYDGEIRNLVEQIEKLVY